MRAEETPETVAYVFLGDGGEETTRLTYGELHRRARTIARAVAERHCRGERALLLFPPGPDFLAAFCGCLCAGAVAVPAPLPLPAQLKRSLPRLRSIVLDARPALVLSTARGRRSLCAREPALGGLPWLVPAELAPGAVDGAPLPGPRSDDLAYLQYTSGSTADPKGVMVSHGNLLHNADYLNRLGGTYDDGSVTVTWMPQFHDYGLVEGLVEPLYNGTPSVCLSPLTFLKRPIRWLEAITRYGASHSGGPSFAYDHCVRRIPPAAREALDLRTWRVAHVGAEPVRRDVLESFRGAFGPHGFRGEAFYPSYGLAEATLVVCAKRRPGRPASGRFEAAALRRGRAVEAAEAGSPGRWLVGCGGAEPDAAVLVVDPESGRPRAAGQVGEVWVASPSVALGYWDRPGESDRAFRARVPGREEAFLRTGDLGFVHGEELFLAGRSKDLIIVAGANHHPQDLEATVETCHGSIRPHGCAAFAAEVQAGEGVVVACEVEGTAADPEAVVAAVRRAVAEEHEIDLHAVVLLPPGRLLRTSSGKLRRRSMAEAFERGLPQEVHRWRRVPSGEGRRSAAEVPGSHTDDLRLWLRERVAEYLELLPEEVPVGRPVAELGLVSRHAVALAGELEQRLGRPLPATLLWEHPTLDALAGHLAGETAPAGRGAVPRGPASPPEPVAILGVACRFPGAPGPDAFWRLLIGGVDAISEVPPERWDLQALFDPDPAAPARMSSRWGGFLEDLRGFDAAFFGISPREAVQMDPRQRLMLELAWEGLESAGIPAETLSEGLTGVFMGVQEGDYGMRVARDRPDLIDAYSGTGNADSVVANRISYWLDLRGPSLAVDTACSGSLVAVHLACQSLLSGECDTALAGGVNLVLEPGPSIFYSKAGLLAADGRCKAFDSRADGIVRSDGAGLVVLRRLSDALAAGDPVRAVILGSAVNQDGRSNGLGAPSARAQEELLRSAYRRAGIDPGSVQYVETHGTGTPLGDPIEAQALGAVLGEGRNGGSRCAIGSVKSNLGHTEPAAGVAGLIKVVLALEHRRLPPTLHVRETNPLIPFDDLPLVLQREAGPWPDGSRRLVAGVSSFGIGGTNAHAVLAEAPAREAGEDVGQAAGETALVPLSARGEEALRERARDILRMLEGAEAGAPGLRDLAYTAARRRAHHPCRLALVASSVRELARLLGAFLEGRETAGLVHGVARDGAAPRLAFAFPGQAGLDQTLVRGLRELPPPFRRAVEECDAALSGLGAPPVIEALEGPPDALRDTAVAQPALFALQVGLAALWKSWGVEPDVVVGQSLGEVAAAHVAGVLGLSEAACVVVHRSRLMARAAGRGGAAVVRLSPEEVQEVLEGYGGRLVLAGSSSPRESVVSGERGALGDLVLALRGRRVPCRRLPGVAIALHGPDMATMAEELAGALAGLEPREARVPIYSTVTGGPVDGTAMGAAHWAANLARPFRLAEALDALAADGFRLFVELGPRPALARAIRETALERGDGPTPRTVPSLRSDGDDRRGLLASLGALYAEGRRVRWEAVAPEGGRCVDLPPYPWQRRPYWIDAEGGAERSRARWPPLRSRRHPLLGTAWTSSLPDARRFWEADLGVRTAPYLRDHCVHGAVVLPAAAILEMARAAGDDLLPGTGGMVLEGVRFRRPLVLPEEGGRRVQLALTPEDDGRASFRLASRAGDGDARWTLHAEGSLRRDGGAPAWERTASREVAEWPAGAPAEGPAAASHYSRLAAMGLGYGPAFRVVRRLRRLGSEVLAELRAADAVAADGEGYGVHPTLLDGAFQAIAGAETDGNGSGGAAWLPAEVAAARWLGAPGGGLRARVRLSAGHNGHRPSADVELVGTDGRAVWEARGVRLVPLGAGSVAARGDGAPRRFEGRWEPLPRGQDGEPGPEAPAPGTWIVLADGQGVGSGLARALSDRGGRAVLVHREPGSAPEDLAPLLERAGAADGRPVEGVVHLWSLDIPPVEGLAAAEVLDGLRESCATVAGLARALVEGGREPAPRLWLVTRGSQRVEREAAAETEVHPAQAALWGLARTLGHQEHPEIWGGVVDLDPAAPEGEAEALLAELLRRDGEDQVALRGDARLGLRLVETADGSGAGARPRIRPDATYLVSGGLGGLGEEVAHWLVSRGARRLLLVNRTPLPPRREWRASGDGAGSPDPRVAAVRRLEARGAQVEPVALDVADQAGLADLLAREREELRPPLRGVVHCAGVVDDRPILELGEGVLETVLRPKAAGAWALHRELGEQPLDLFVLFSSAAAFLPAPGQAAYAAANAFLDALAHHRRARGLPGLSVSWGPWEGAGMAGRDGLRARFEAAGVRALGPEEALAALGELLALDAGHRVVAAGDWDRVGRAYFPGRTPPAMLGGLLGAPGAALLRQGAVRPLFEAVLAETDPEARRSRTRAWLRELAAVVLRLEPERLDPTEPLDRLGIDSIMAMELKGRIEESLGVTLPMADWLEVPSVAQIADGLLPRLAGSAAADQGVTPS